jgi:hypothetical protein
MLADRKACRRALAQLIQGGVPAAQAVYPYQILSPEGQSPIITIVSAGAERKPMTLRGVSSSFYLVVQVLVLHTGDNWTPEEAEDLIDDVELEIAKVIESNQDNDNWSALVADDPSMIQRITIGGYAYLTETIPVKVTVHR